MPIKLLTPMEAVTRYTEQEISRLRSVLLRNLAYIGEECVNAARSLDTYKDQTGNLRSSIGYVLVEDGRVIKKSDFAASDKGSDGAKGSRAGKRYIKELAARFPRGITLLVVAGMNYAAYVSAKGYDVIDIAELTADKRVKELFKDLGIK